MQTSYDNECFFLGSPEQTKAPQTVLAGYDNDNLLSENLANMLRSAASTSTV